MTGVEFGERARRVLNLARRAGMIVPVVKVEPGAERRAIRRRPQRVVLVIPGIATRSDGEVVRDLVDGVCYVNRDHRDIDSFRSEALEALT